MPRPSFEDYVRLSLEEIRSAGAGQVQVQRRLRALLDDLETEVPDSRLVALRHQRHELDLVMTQGRADARDVATGVGTDTGRGRSPR